MILHTIFIFIHVDNGMAIGGGFWMIIQTIKTPQWALIQSIITIKEAWERVVVFLGWSIKKKEQKQVPIHVKII